MMGDNSEGRDRLSELENAVTRELLTTIAEVQEKQARTASDPEDKASHERLAAVARKNLRDLK